MSTRTRRARPSYPRLTLAAALGSALGVSGCGPDGLDTLKDSLEQPLTTTVAPDAGTGPKESDFYGGGAPFEVLEDGGVK